MQVIIAVVVAISMFVLVGCVSHTDGPDTGTNEHFLPNIKTIVPLNTVEGRRLLWESKSQEPFWALSQFYVSQPDLGSCSVASCSMVLNALPVERPVSPSLGKFRLYTPDNFFNRDVEAIVSQKEVSASGMSLDQLGKVLSTFPINVRVTHASGSEISSFRSLLRESLSKTDQYILVNYLRSSLGQESGGHISPVGAYHDAADMVLILDTSNYKYPWAWVKTDDLWRAMSVVADPASHVSRGYVLVSTKQ
jgi:Phytochelatin synthase